MGYAYSEEYIEVKRRVLDAFNEYGDWWRINEMAKWVNSDPKVVAKVYDELEAQGRLERRETHG